MKEVRSGWVIANQNHPNNPNKEQIYPETFAYTRKECIAKFTRGCGSDWRYWYRKYNFRAKKAEVTIEVKNTIADSLRVLKSSLKKMSTEALEFRLELYKKILNKDMSDRQKMKINKCISLTLEEIESRK